MKSPAEGGLDSSRCCREMEGLGHGPRPAEVTCAGPGVALREEASLPRSHEKDNFFLTIGP